MRPLFLLAVALGTQFPFSDQPAPPTPPVIRQRFSQDVQTRNIEDLMTLFTPDAVETTPADGDVSGASGIRAKFEALFAHFDSTLSLDLPRNHAEGQPRHFTRITETGRYVWTRTERSSGAATRTCGAYTFGYTRNTAGSGWLLSQALFTDEGCAPGPNVH